jgi:hypothetical protein
VSDRRTTDATLIEAVRILARTITTEDGVIPACLAEVATRLEELVEERRSISTLLQKVESLEAENKRLREERRWVPVGERLPEDDEWVEMAGTWGENVGYFDGDQWLNTESETVEYLVTHWRKRTPGPEGDG